MTYRHPPRRRLQRWLDGKSSRRLERHIDGCEHCQTILEELSALDDTVVATLSEAVSPPVDLSGRTRDGVDERLRDEAAVGAFLDLFTIGWDTTRALIDPLADPHLAPRESDGDEGGLP